MLMWGSLGGWPQAPPPDGPTVTLEIEVSLPDDAVFYIPVVGDGGSPNMAEDFPGKPKGMHWRTYWRH
jgi:hypothetical protein